MKNEYRIHRLQEKEPLYITWGRLYAHIVYKSDDKRAKELVKAIDYKLKRAKVVEDYFTSLESEVL